MEKSSLNLETCLTEKVQELWWMSKSQVDKEYLEQK